MYINIKVARDQDFASQIGSHKFVDLVNFDKVGHLFLSSYALLSVVPSPCLGVHRIIKHSAC